MTRILIVSKTHMKNAACVGAISMKGDFYRLLDIHGNNQPIDTDFEIRQVWDIEFTERPNKKPPHIEDIFVTSKSYFSSLKDEITMLQVIERLNIPIWRGSPDNLFDGKLNWSENGSGYINEENGIPNNSVGFWLPDRDLTKRIVFEKVRYNYPNINGWRSLPYVGYAKEVDVIPANTLVRVSLARWWDTNGTTEERCSLQLSGWYDLPEQKIEEDLDIDLPF